MGLREELEARFGNNFSDSLVERLSHSADMGFVPQLVWANIKINIIPDYVIYPTSVEDVIDAVKIALKYKVPITPYGRGTNRYGNALTTEGGILLDFSKMDKVEIDESNMVAITEPGATWKLVDLAAQNKGLQLRTFPSSYDSTVGGGIAGDALGIGSYEYGFISDNVSFVEMVNPRGDLVHLEGGNLALVAGAEGTTGIIVKAGIRLRKYSPTEALVLSFNSFDDVIKAIGEFYREVIPAWHVQVRGPTISSYIAQKFNAKLSPGKWNMIILYPSLRSSLVEPKLYRIAQAFSAEVYEGEWTGWWSFNHGVVAALRTKGLLIHQHGLIHYTKINDLVKELEGTLGKLGELSPNSGFDLDIDLEKREVLLVNAFTEVSLKPSDKKLIYDLAKNTLMMDSFVKVGGSLLSIGMFGHKYSRNRLSAMGKTFQQLGIDRYELIKKYKEEMDPEELFNPGKVFDPKKRGKVVFEIVRRQQEALQFRFGIGFVKAVVPGGEVNGFSAVKRFLDIFTDYSLECIDCAMCVTVCPQFRLIPQVPYAPKGMFDFVKGAISYHHLYGSVDIPDSAIAEISGCHKCGLCDGVCPAKIPISSLLVKLNSIVAKKVPEEPPVKIPLTQDPEVASIVDNNSDIALWVGKYLVDNPTVAIAALKILKALGLKVKLVGTEYDSGFMSYISGGEKLQQKIKSNEEILSNSLEVITIAPEDYKVLSEVYRDYANMLGLKVTYEVSPIDIRVLKSIQIDGKGEEIYLHVACFSSSYANDIIRRLSDMGFRVRKVEGCSGAVLEKNIGKRADMMARALGSKYPMLITLCPLAAAKFRESGVNAKTLIEFIAEKLRINIPTEVKVSKIELSSAERNSLQATVLNSIVNALTKRVNLIADTVTFTSSGVDEYKKIIEPLVKEALEDASNSINNYVSSIVDEKKKNGMKYEDLIAYLSSLTKELNAVISSIQFDSIVDGIVEQVKRQSTEEFDSSVLKSSLVFLIRDNEQLLKEKSIKMLSVS
ncbi:FAD-binding oxidoreductase [Sulfolobus sp. S-194]|uniref:FAD-binding and (Fe-S)-binding domain-containing protein n=1 Tax=Sulfolobus sp. S-194 TaxID=2512240 RepID=UPI0014371500|nr:FAD-binding and (Fe-S)-binding domain-containing protein [Sulfolobus sp. S-194]QIW24940.1 FAD-binding oxidoreductase [Sulfolobus sp. S-194]